MDAGTKAVYEKAILLYEMFLAGKPVNVIDPDGSKPSKRLIKARILQLEEAIK